MKKLLVTFVLVLSTALAQGSTYSQSQNLQNQNQQQSALQPGTIQSAETCAQEKSIDDPAEYNTYNAAVNTPDPARRAAALEAFILQYPNSVAKIPALQKALAAYQDANNPAKVEETTKHILQLDSNNVTTLAIDAYANLLKLENGDTAAAGTARDEAQRGLQALATWQRPCDMPQQQYDNQRTQMMMIFNSAAALADLKTGDYTAARDHYLKIIEADPSIANYSRIGAADLQMKPIDLNGFWYLAKAITLAQTQNEAQKNDQLAQQLDDYGKANYRNYHGSDEGWNQIVAAAASQTSVPANFTIKPKLTDCALIVTVAEQNDPGTLSFSDWEMVLSHRDCSREARPAADKIWQFIQDKQKMQETRLKKAKHKNAGPKNHAVKLLLSVKVISTTKHTIQAAITEENQKANIPDLQITLAKPLKLPPAKGSEINVAGLFTDYTSNPFMFIMQKGEVRQAKAATPIKAAAPAKPGAHQPKSIKPQKH